ncbi:MAG: hypothetical protein AB1611_17120 [bacterium]
MKADHIDYPFFSGLFILLCLMHTWAFAQAIATSLPQPQRMVHEFITLILQGDICTLLDRCEVPPLPETQRRSLFSIPSREQTCKQVGLRLERDQLLRDYIDRLRELILVFHRLNISKKSTLNLSSFSADSPHHFIAQIEIKAPPTPLAITISPELAEKDLLLSFTLSAGYSEKGWTITHLSKLRIFPL